MTRVGKKLLTAPKASWFLMRCVKYTALFSIILFVFGFAISGGRTALADFKNPGGMIAGLSIIVALVLGWSAVATITRLRDRQRHWVGVCCSILYFGLVAVFWCLATQTTAPSVKAAANDGGLHVIGSYDLETGNIVERVAIANTADDGFVVAGAIPNLHSAWATRIDKAGKVMWRHVLPYPEPVPKHDQVTAPTYSGIAVMPDDSVFLCGDMPGSAGAAGGILTHLDRNGKVLLQARVNTKSKEGVSGQLRRCVASKDGLVAVGDAGSVTRMLDINASVPVTTTVDYYYWVASFDAAGRLRQDRLVPVRDSMRGIPTAFPILTETDAGEVIFSAVKGNTSELIRLNAALDVVASDTIADAVSACRPVRNDGSLMVASRDLESLLVASLDRNFGMVESSVGRYEPGSGIGGSYCLSDGSLLVFGGCMVDGHMRAAVVRIANEELTMSVVGRRGDSYWFAGSTGTQQANVYAGVRITRRPDGTVNEDIAGKVLDGVSIQLIKISNNQ